MNYQNSNSRRINHSQGRNISDYNNTLSMNRSMQNNLYMNNTPNRSRRSPLQINPNDLPPFLDILPWRYQAVRLL